MLTHNLAILCVDSKFYSSCVWTQHLVILCADSKFELACVFYSKFELSCDDFSNLCCLICSTILLLSL